MFSAELKTEIQPRPFSAENSANKAEIGSGPRQISIFGPEHTKELRDKTRGSTPAELSACAQKVATDTAFTDAAGSKCEQHVCTTRRLASRCAEQNIELRDDCAVAEFRSKDSVKSAYFESQQAATEFLNAGPWRLYINQRGKKPYLVRSIRIPGKNPTTEYAHRFLYSDQAPRDGDFLNLRSSNFCHASEQPRRPADEIAQLLTWIPWEEFNQKARRTLERLKADDAISAALARIVERLESLTVTFENVKVFQHWTLAILDAELNLRRAMGGSDVVLGDTERAIREVRYAQDLLDLAASNTEPLDMVELIFGAAAEMRQAKNLMRCSTASRNKNIASECTAAAALAQAA